MISGPLVELLYEPASIQRWNDHIRPAQGFTELDKQAQKMVFAYILGKFEEGAGARVDWLKVIEYGLFELLHRTKLTDIKPPIFHRLMAEKGVEINEWVLGRYRGQAYLNGGLFERFEGYLGGGALGSLEQRIIGASHYLATKWEFDIVYGLNPGLYGLEKERRQIEAQLGQHSSLCGVKEVVESQATKNLANLISQLRFQLRWGQTPRVPQTSVLGHSLIVALLSYFCSIQIGACPKRIYNNYFCGLFHDLPEVLTRDIVAPVKRAVEGLDEIIKDIESAEVEEALYPLLPESWRDEVRYFVEDEFQDRIVRGGARLSGVSLDDYNEDVYSPVDGEILKACDQLAAHVEAFLSFRHGIKSQHLREAVSSIFSAYKDRFIHGVNFGEVFHYFDPVNLA